MDVENERGDGHQQQRQRHVAHDPGIAARRHHLDPHEEIARDRAGPQIVAFGADPQLGAVFDPGRNQESDASIRFDDSLAQTVPSLFCDALGTVLDL